MHSGPGPHSRRLAIAFLAGALLGISAAPGHASRPVARTITGCVVDGVLISDNGYTIHVRAAGDRTPVDLTPYEGQKIRYTGSLLPGDVYFVRTRPAVLGPCP